MVSEALQRDNRNGLVNVQSSRSDPPIRMIRMNLPRKTRERAQYRLPPQEQLSFRF
jgi:hypothetical protein